VLHRHRHVKRVLDLLSRFPVVALLGPRQVGKSTLAGQVARSWGRPLHTYDLERPADVGTLTQPGLALEPLRGLILLDEIHRRPELFPVLRYLADRPRIPARFLVLGSASPELLLQASESLAGRIAFHELGGFDLEETGVAKLSKLWLRGGFPRAFLAPDDEASFEWRDVFVRTFLERDIPQFGLGVPASTMARFWTMLAHLHGGPWNASGIGSSMGVSHPTVRRYLDFLTATFMVRQLRPWHENLGKRQVKAPKVYLADSGILHFLHGIHSLDRLESHPVCGPSWEGFGIARVISRLGASDRECYFWGTHNRAELDLLVVRDGRRFGFEFKRTDAPDMTKSMHIALEDLKLDSLDVIHAGKDTWPMAPKVRAVALSRLLQDLKPLK
jgi:predicted AAA+ superfamily ATPase